MDIVVTNAYTFAKWIICRNQSEQFIVVAKWWRCVQEIEYKNLDSTRWEIIIRDNFKTKWSLCQWVDVVRSWGHRGSNLPQSATLRSVQELKTPLLEILLETLDLSSSQHVPDWHVERWLIRPYVKPGFCLINRYCSLAFTWIFI